MRIVKSGTRTILVSESLAVLNRIVSLHCIYFLEAITLPKLIACRCKNIQKKLYKRFAFNKKFNRQPRSRLSARNLSVKSVSNDFRKPAAIRSDAG